MQVSNNPGKTEGYDAPFVSVVVGMVAFFIATGPDTRILTNTTVRTNSEFKVVCIGIHGNLANTPRVKR